MKCLNCEKELTGKQQKFCGNKCKCQYNNFHANDGKGYQSYENQKKRGWDRKRKFVEMKGGKCEMCGYSKSLRALTFHHIIPSNKSFPLDIRNLSNHTYQLCLDELDKCDLLCFNCHMEIHDEWEMVGVVGIEPTTQGL